MHTRILALDNGVVRQTRLIRRTQAEVIDLEDWGPRLRLLCRHRTFRRFEADLQRRTSRQQGPALTFVGSGDFHHISLALIRALDRPCNLLVLDNHPDWMRGVPILHCGTWLYHAARLPHVHRIFHVGGDVDFDNAYRWLAPWPLLRSGKIVVLPARRAFWGRAWSQVPHQPVRSSADDPASGERLWQLLWPYRFDLASRPLYVSLDKDVLPATEAAVNWDSGHLTRREVFDLLALFQEASGGLLGLDVVGDWSRVHAEGLLRQTLLQMEHPAVERWEGTFALNERFNLALVDWLNSRAVQHRVA
jgi:arginase family enzyme